MAPVPWVSATTPVGTAREIKTQMAATARLRDTNSPAAVGLSEVAINSSDVGDRVMMSAAEAREYGVCRTIGRILSLVGLCVLAGAAPVSAEEGQRPAAPADLAGRWEGNTYELSRARSAECGGGPCKLTLDLVRCGAGWCGVEVVGAERRCGLTALKLDGGTGADNGSVPVFKGSLSLAKGTEPYVVEVYLVAPGAGDTGPSLQIVGDTGGEFRVFRRSFPFNATLAKISDATCRPESTVSMLAE
jgi:hypothetical protein